MEFEVIETDVLVIGGGAAGCRAAIEAIEKGARVILVTKGRIGRSGCSPLAMHISSVFPDKNPQDSWKMFFQDAIRAGEYMADQDLAKILFSEELKRGYMDLEKYGLYLARNQDGSLDTYHRSGHSFDRMVHMNSPHTGKEIMKALKSKLLQLEADFVEDTMVTNLMTLNGSVVGATVFNYKNGIFKVFSAKSTVLCTGHCNQIYPLTSETEEETGDGFAMAYRCGAELIDMENRLILVGMPLAPYKSVRNIGGARFYKVTGGHKPKLVNALGEDYIKSPRYRYLWESNVAPKTIRFLATYTEIKEGRGTPAGGVYQDFREVPEMKKVIREARTHKALESMDFDPTKELEEVGLFVHNETGGVRINVFGESTVPGLYAAGGAVGAAYGFQRIAGYGIGLGLVFGRRAGKAAAIRAHTMEQPEIDWSQVEKERELINGFLEHAGEDGVSPLQVKNMIRENNWKEGHIGVIKNEAGLTECLEAIERIRREEVPRMTISSDTKRYNYELVEALEVPNMLLVSEITARAALLRKESRGPFLRSDYLERNNKEWLKHIIVRQENGEMRLHTDPVKLLYLKPGNHK